MKAIDYLTSLIDGQKMGLSIPVQVSELEMLKTFMEVEQIIADGHAALAELKRGSKLDPLYSPELQ